MTCFQVWRFYDDRQDDKSYITLSFNIEQQTSAIFVDVVSILMLKMKDLRPIQQLAELTGPAGTTRLLRELDES